MSLEISKTKGVKVRVKVWGEVNKYERSVGIILSHIRTTNSLNGELKTVRLALKYAAEGAFTHTMRALRLREPGKEGTLEAKIKFNDSVSALRTAHTRMMKRICEWK